MADTDHIGIITRIAVKNFVTYDEVVVKPGKNLNLIIGPNGTGKSTIVSAIVLCLGGSPKVIGRASTIKEYVKAGHTTASIEIDLQNGPDKVVTVKREFNTQNHTTWFINHKTANGKQISDLMTYFNIQVNNLCQFLPQDKVQEFSKLSSQDLLVETERSVGDPKLLEYHVQLKELRVKQAELETLLETNTRLLTKEKQICDTLKDKVGHIQEQKIIEKKLKLLKQKKAWIIYSERRDELDKAKVERDEAKKTKEKLEKKMRPIELEITKLKNSIQNIEKTAKQRNSEISTKYAQLTGLQDGIEQSEILIDDAEKLCQEKIKNEQETDERIAGFIEQKNKLENDLTHKINEVGSVEAVDMELASILRTVSNHKNNVNNLKGQQTFLAEKIQNCIRKMRVEQQNLQEVQNIEAERLRLLHRMNKDAYNGVMWLRSNKHLFSKTVYEPMILLINLQDASYAKYFETVISPRDLFAFVCEDKNDMNLLLRHLRDQQKLTINAVHSDPNREVDDRPPVPLENLRRYGFEHYLVSLISAPQTVLNYLISNCQLTKIPIGNDNILRHLDNIPTDIRLFFSTKKVYNIKFSDYSNEKSTSESSIIPRNSLSITIDTDRINHIKNELTRLDQEQKSLQQDLESLNEKIAQEEKKAMAHKEIRKKLEMEKGKIQELQRRIAQNEKRLADEQKSRKSIDEIRAESKQKIEQLILEQLRKYKNYNERLDDYYKSVIVHEEIKVQVKLQKDLLAVKENDSYEVRDQYENAERNFRNLENEIKPLKEEVQSLFEEARKLTDGISCNDKVAFQTYQNDFLNLPTSLQAIIDEIQKTQAKAFNVNDKNEAQRILDQFTIAKRNVKKCSNEISVKERELITITEEINKVKEEWLPMLKALVEKINKNFSTCFTKMKCAGEVTLVDGGTPMDFAKYGLKIKVKFRDTDELQALSRHHQSGGERTVTTAAYMISLQELTRVPFRCVDEINQGMDATNERRVFEMIVDVTSRTNSAQYFLLTPKLLPGLKYNESMTVLTVFNGKYMAPCSKFDIHENIDRICNVIKNRLRAE